MKQRLCVIKVEDAFIKMLFITTQMIKQLWKFEQLITRQDIRSIKRSVVYLYWFLKTSFDTNTSIK